MGDNWSDAQINNWKENNLVEKELMDQVINVEDVKARLAEVNRKINSHQEYIKQVFQNQARLRENIKSLEKVSNSSLVDRYLKDLNQEEDNLIKTRQAIDHLERQKVQTEGELKALKLNLTSAASKHLEKVQYKYL
jgi:hypothetical protein